MIDAVLWDMDGVLVDSERLVREIFIELMTEAGYMADPDAVYLQSIGLNPAAIMALYENYMPSRTEAEYYFHRVAEIYQQRMVQELTLKPGVREALTTVADNGIAQMVVTSTRASAAQAKLDKFTLLPFFRGLVCGDEVTHGKPHPEPYLTACQQLAVNPSRALVIEDSPNGVRAGLSAGAMVVHVPDLVATDPAWEGELFAALDSLESFPDFLRSVQAGVWV